MWIILLSISDKGFSVSTLLKRIQKNDYVYLIKGNFHNIEKHLMLKKKKKVACMYVLEF